MRHIIFISDLHIGDGNSKDDFNQDELFENLVLEWNELKNPEIVIVGDGFEILESNAVRNLGLLGFWESVEMLDGTVIDDINKAHPTIFETLNKFKGTVWYVIGNHDYYILKNEKLQTALKEKIKNLNIVPYYYDEQSSILAVHGNQFDSINKFTQIDGELIPPLGDFIARYMMVNFDEDLKKHLPEHVVKDYDNVRPVLDVFLWLEKIADVYENSVDLLKLWIDNFIEMMKEEEAQKWMKKNYPLMSKLSIIFLNKIGGIKLGELIVRIIMNIRKLKKTDYLKKAAIKVFKNTGILKTYMDGYVDNPSNMIDLKSIDGIVVGHSHKPVFEITKINGQLKFFMNCGSWKPVVEKRAHGMFQKYFEIFYGIAKIEGSDVEIMTGTINKIKKREVID
ncbi:MAG: metallophosphoesterase [Fervidobacterium sp.]|nr:metallophosphoesterase [Fervidobacterium sp.]